MVEKMTLGNLTGHDINILNENNEVVRVIKPSPFDPPLKAYCEYKKCGEVSGIPCIKSWFYLNESRNYLMELQFKYSGLIVSKITAECLKNLGYTGRLYIPSKMYKDGKGKPLGIKQLSIYN